MVVLGRVYKTLLIIRDNNGLWPCWLKNLGVLVWFRGLEIPLPIEIESLQWLLVEMRQLS